MRLLAAWLISLVIALALGSPPARASICSVPNSFSNGTVANANQVNANFSAIAGCANSLDWSNVGAGFWASQIVPITVAQATFGGSVAYTFPYGLVLGSGAPAGDPDIHSDGTSIYIEADAAGGSIYLRPNGVGSSVAQSVFGNTGNLSIPGTFTATGPGSFGGAVTATSFSGAGTGLTNIPAAAIISAPWLTAITAGTGISAGGGTAPSVGLSHGDYVTISPGSQQSGSVNVSGQGTFAGGVAYQAGSTLHAIAWGSCIATQNSSCIATLSSPMVDTGYKCTTSVLGNILSTQISTAWSQNTASTVTLYQAANNAGGFNIQAICVE